MTATHHSDPTFAEVIGRYHRWTATRKPLNLLLIYEQRDRAKLIGDQNTLRIIAELIARQPLWRSL